ncbi:hypothetical protein [Ramlibacter sp. PS4R-6]|uniref:hypothetical protein n=1 Tax=Ramlibacter sp. PS4R-6 TaxID=3133438 RepID=UPI0030A4A766
MRARLFHLLVATALASAATAALAQLHDVAWDERGGAALRQQVAAGKSLEWCAPLRPGDDIHWEFDSGDALEMNVHFHEGNNVVYPVTSAEAASRNGRLTAPAEHVYCWMWTNKGRAPVALQARLQKALRRQP